MKLLTSGRADYWIDATTFEALDADELLGANEGVFAVDEIFSFPLFMWFADNPRGRMLKQYLDDALDNP